VPDVYRQDVSEAVDRYRRVLVEHVLEGPGIASPEHRRAAFDHRHVPEPLRALIDKVVGHAHEVTDEDVAAVRAAGVSEDEIFELTICASLGEATRQLDGALAALDAATAERAVRDT
jgi:hypothetical protein